VVQAVFGGLTVLLSLRPVVVAAHLVLGTVFLQCVFLLWYGTFRPVSASAAGKRVPARLRWFLVLTAFIAFVQIALGGLVSSGGAALACPSFPHCGLSQTEGSLLPAQQMQMRHREIGIGLGVMVLAAAIWASRAEAPPRVKKLLFMAFGLVIVQIVIGAGNIHTGIVPALSVAHLLIAEGILLKLLLALREFRPAWSGFFEVLSAPVPMPRASAGRSLAEAGA
jgi:cytochrome c oxidase assembly protein subunit 15